MKINLYKVTTFNKQWKLIKKERHHLPNSSITNSFGYLVSIKHRVPRKSIYLLANNSSHSMLLKESSNMESTSGSQRMEISLRVEMKA